MWRARVVGNLRTRTSWVCAEARFGHLVAPGNRQRPACKCSLRSNDRGPCIPCLTHFKTAFPASTEGCRTKTLFLESSVSLRAPWSKQRNDGQINHRGHGGTQRTKNDLCLSGSMRGSLPCSCGLRDSSLPAIRGQMRFFPWNAEPLAPPAAAGQNSGFCLP